MLESKWVERLFLLCVSIESNKQKKCEFILIFRQTAVLHSLESDESGLAARKTAGFKILPNKGWGEGHERSINEKFQK